MLGRIAHLSSRNNNIAFNRNTNNYALSKRNNNYALNNNKNNNYTNNNNNNSYYTSNTIDTKYNNKNFSFNTKDSFASLVSDYTPYYLNYNQDESNNVYISALAGYSNYKNSSGFEFGLSFGYDKEIVDEFFAGVYASISKSYINTEGMNLDGFNYSLAIAMTELLLV